MPGEVRLPNKKTAMCRGIIGIDTKTALLVSAFCSLEEIWVRGFPSGRESWPWESGVLAAKVVTKGREGVVFHPTDENLSWRSVWEREM